MTQTLNCPLQGTPLSSTLLSFPVFVALYECQPNDDLIPTSLQLMMAGLWNDITGIANAIYSSLPGVPPPKEVEKVIVKEVDAMIRTRAFVRIAGVSGALSVAMAAYGAHGRFAGVRR